MKLSIGSIILLLCVASAFSQKEAVTIESVTNEGTLLTPVKTPLPNYPKVARNAGLGGRILVAFLIDETGRVTRVNDATGPYPVCKSVSDPKVFGTSGGCFGCRKEIEISAVSDENKRFDSLYRFDPLGYVAPNQEIVGAKIADGSEKKEFKLAQVGDSNGVAVTNKTKTAPGGVLNGKALSLPRPLYPAAAVAIRAEGAVPVQVLIFEDGTIYSAEALSGHPLLRASSEVAACSAKFSPTLLSGNPVKVTGIITYNYVGPK